MEIDSIKYTDINDTYILVETTTGEKVIVPWPSVDWYSRFIEEWIEAGNTIGSSLTPAEELKLSKDVKREEIKAEGLRRIQEFLPFVNNENEVEAWKSIVAGSLRSLPPEWTYAAAVYKTTKDSVITLNGLSNVTVVNNIDVVSDISWPVAGSPLV